MLKRITALLVIICLLPVCALGEESDQLQRVTELFVRAAVLSDIKTLDKTMPEAFEQTLLSLLEQQDMASEDETKNTALLFELADMQPEGKALPGDVLTQSTEILVAIEQTSVQNGKATVWANVYNMSQEIPGEEAIPVGRAMLLYNQAEESLFGWRLTSLTLADWVEHSEMNMMYFEQEGIPYSLQYPDVFDLEEVTVNGTSFLAENTDGVCVSVQVVPGESSLLQLAAEMPDARIEESRQYLTTRATDEGWVTFTMIIVNDNLQYILKYVYSESMTELALYEDLMENAFTASVLSVG